MNQTMPFNDVSMNQQMCDISRKDLSGKDLSRKDLSGKDLSMVHLKKKKKSYNSVMAELLKPPPKEDKPNIHLSGGGKFSKLDKI
jgi:uncharacterized protein YjbI with pentapeptide repeats